MGILVDLWLLENCLKMLQRSETKKIRGLPMAPEEIESLSSELKQMQRLLKNGGVQNRENREKLCGVKNLIYDAEDAIGEMLSDGSGFPRKGWFATVEKYLTMGSNFMLNMRIKSLIRRIREVNHGLLACQSLLPPGQLGDSNDSDDIPPPADDRNSVDLRRFWKYENDSTVGIEAAKEVISRLLLEEEEGGQELKVISIFGMGGIGKTTLARKIYQDDSVRGHFDCVAWTSVGRRFQTRLVYEDILLSLTAHTREEMMSYSPLDLAELVYDFLQPRKYLIVLDDVWSTDVWDCLNIAFPLSGNSGSRVVMTTRSDEVARSFASKNGFLHQMSRLNEELSLKLLLMTAFRTQSPDSKDFLELTEIARDMVRSCSGIPLVIKVLGGLLASKKPTPSEWKIIHQKMDSFKENSDVTVEQVLNLSYASLPLHLKACFLYFGIFPEDAEIESESLYLLWLAEGLFVPSGKGSMMDIAELCLYQLCIRNLVLVYRPDVPTGRWFKSFLVHDLIRNLCLSKQVEDDFCVDVYFRRAKDIKVCPSSLQYSTPKIRRLALFFEVGCLDLHKRDVNNQHLQSVPITSVFCNSQQSSLTSAYLLSGLKVFYLCNYNMLSLPVLKRELNPWHFLSSIDVPEGLSDLSASKSLRVLHCSGFNFDMTSLPSGIGKLRHLRYLSLRHCFIESLPSAICSLTNLETLDMRGCTRMILPVELQQLTSLRYLYLPYNFEVQGAGKLQLNDLINLEILVNFDSTLCELKGLCELTRLEKLVATICGNLEELAEMDNCIKTSLNRLHFSSLRVKMSGYYSSENHFIVKDLLEFLNLNVLRMEGHLGKLPIKVPESLSELSLSGSELDEDPMEKLEKLPNLLVLSLRDNAFMGKYMTCSVSGMPQLRHLALLNLEKLESFVVEKGGMPNLSTFVLERCQNLKLPPEDLSFRTSLQEFKVLYMPPEFTDRVKHGERGFTEEQVCRSSKQADL